MSINTALHMSVITFQNHLAWGELVREIILNIAFSWSADLLEYILPAVRESNWKLKAAKSVPNISHIPQSLP